MEILQPKSKASVRSSLLNKSITKITKRINSSQKKEIKLKIEFSPASHFLRRSNNNTPTFQFSQLPRFDTQLDNSVKCNLHLGISAFRFTKTKHLNTSKNFKSAIQINKNMKPFSPIEKVENLRLSSMKFEARRSLNKLANSVIIHMKKKNSEHKYVEKIRKLSFRQKQSVFHIQEFPMIQKGWVLICICAGMNKIFKEKIKIRKIYKKKIKLLGKIFSLISRCIGKIIRRLKLFRNKTAINVTTI